MENNHFVVHDYNNNQYFFHYDCLVQWIKIESSNNTNCNRTNIGHCSDTIIIIIRIIIMVSYFLIFESLFFILNINWIYIHTNVSWIYVSIYSVLWIVINWTWLLVVLDMNVFPFPNDFVGVNNANSSTVFFWIW